MPKMNAMNSGLENGVFECPKGFSIEDVASQLYLEDLDEDSELWLVRMPSHVDPSALENQKIDLSADLNKISNGDNNFECIAERCKMPNLSLVLPQKESRQLTRVKKTFQGSILLYDTLMEDDDDLQVKIEDEGESIREENNQETDDNFVNNEEIDNNFVKPKSKKHKHHKAAHSEVEDLPVKMEDDGENVQEEDNEETDENFVKSKSKKHKRNKELKAAHSESDISSKNENGEAGTTRKKKKSHKKNKSIVKIEPISSEGDDFPNCVSQQN